MIFDNLNLANVLTVAQAEKRLTRRLKRYWLFLVLAFVFGTGIFIYYSVLHAFFSSFSATLGNINPHYLLSVVSIVFQGVFTLGIVFIAFDIRARDVRERIVEVLDCRPVSNLELILGRFLALFQLAWYPVLILCVFLQALGWVLPRLGAPIGNTVEIDSMIGFATLVSIPSFFFTISLVFLVTLLVRNRVLSTVVALGVIGGLLYLMTRIPVTAYPLVDNFGITIGTLFPTDLTTRIGTFEGWLQRGGFLVIGCSFLGFCAAIHPRLDDSNRRSTALISTAIFGAGCALLLTSSLSISGVSADPVWVAAHEAVEEQAAPDIVRIEAGLVVDPGSALRAEVEIEFQAPASGSLSSALFTLNPGLTLDSVTGANGQALDFTHANGLLQIDLPSALAAGQRSTVHLSYGGKPDNQFAYLDSRLKFESLTDFNARGLQGTEPGMFYDEFVALMPGTYWLPLAGNDLNRDDTRESGRDFFNVAVEVEVPQEWLVAGPGARREVTAEQQGNIRFRFAPQPQVSKVALIASEFVSYATQIEGMNFEFLVYPGHTKNFEVLAPMRGEIETWVTSRLQLAREAGLVYPFDAFTIVEVPNGLRVYEGGWRLDTSLAPPAMMLMTESGFPTSRFDFSIQTIGGNTPNGNTSAENGLTLNEDSFQNVSFERLLTFFTSDLSGGNLFMGISRSYFSHHTVATGDEAIALNFILDMLATLVISDERYYFSMYNDINRTVTSLINTAVSGGAVGDSITERTIDSLATNVDVWNSALGQSLANIDTEREPEKTINLLTLKGGELAQAIYDVLGPVRSGEVLATLLREHRAASFRLADVVAVLASYDPNLSLLFEESFNSTELPGFVAERAEVYRLPDGPSGEQRYQLLVAIRNDEPVAGFTRIAWLLDSGTRNQPDFFTSEPIRIDSRSTIEFGIVLTTPPASVLVNPYLSVNRTQFTAGIFDKDAIRRVDAEPFEGVRSLPWSDVSERIIADDLDQTFFVVDANGTSAYDRTTAEGELNVPLDQGIRINQGNAPDNWNRIPSATAYGKYRHTFVSIMAGDGDKTATLTSDIPRAGLWDLEVHIPAAAAGARTNNMKGTWNMRVTSANGTETIAFDNRGAIPGWNLIGSYELPVGEVKVEFTNQTDAIVVVVDAIAWTPVNSR